MHIFLHSFETRDSSRNYRRGNSDRHYRSERSPARSPTYGSPPPSRRYAKEPVYNTLLIRNFSEQVRREDIKESLSYEFQKFGDVKISVSRDYAGNRIAYANFESTESAKSCKNARGHLVMHDKRLTIDIVYPNSATAKFSKQAAQRDRGSPPRRSRSPLSPSRSKRQYTSPNGGYDDRTYYDGGKKSGRQSYGGAGDGRSHGPDRSVSRSPTRSRSRSSGRGSDDSGAMSEPSVNPALMEKLIPPEDDAFATRTIFVGNLDNTVTKRALCKVFGRYGRIDEVDIKRSPQGPQNTYAFIKYPNLDISYRARQGLNGKTVLGKICKLGYGKATFSSKIWVGGLGSWTKTSDLEREFDRFGAIRYIDYHKGDTSASILYETADAAQAACSQMRGFLMPGAETRLRMDFLDPEPGMPGYEKFEFVTPKPGFNQGIPPKNNRFNNKDFRGGRPSFDDRSPSHGKSRDKSPSSKSKSSEKKKDNPVQTEMQFKHFHAKSCYSLHDLCQCFDPPCWQGGFMLKKIAFPVLFFLLDGEMSLFNKTTADPTSPTGRQTMFSFNQRLSLTEDRLTEIRKRLKSTKQKYCLIVAVPGVPENLNPTGNPSFTIPQHKPLRGLVKYFKDKDAAGIVSLPLHDTLKDEDSTDDKQIAGVLHAFPPGSFATEQLLKIGPSLQPQFFADDYMVILLVKGQSTLI